MTKQCYTCKKEKSFTEFHKDGAQVDGYRYRCKSCCRVYRRKKWIGKGGGIREQEKEWRDKNPNSKQCSRCKQVKAKTKFNKNKDRLDGCVSACKICYNKRSIELRQRDFKYREWARKHYQKKKKNSNYRLNINMSRAINKALCGNKNGRHWESLIGYNQQELRRHLEKLFLDDMTWDNYGKWHIDHIIPKSAYNYTQAEHIDFKRCWSLSNLQPMWAKDNQSKGDSVGDLFQPSLRFIINAQ